MAGPAFPPLRLVDRRRPRRTPRRLPLATAEAIRLQAETLLRHYIERMDALWWRLSHSDRSMEAGRDLLASIAKDAATFPELPASPAHEPYRAKCRLISAKLRKTLESLRSIPAWTGAARRRRRGSTSGGMSCSPTSALIADDLARRPAAAAAGAIRDVIRLVEVFGVHMLTLDLRQHSARHASALDEILRGAGVCPGYASLSPDDRLDVLAREIDGPAP